MLLDMNPLQELLRKILKKITDFESRFQTIELQVQNLQNSSDSVGAARISNIESNIAKHTSEIA